MSSNVFDFESMHEKTKQLLINLDEDLSPNTNLKNGSIPFIILKSSIMSKKDDNVIGTYDSFLFELHADGQLICYETKSNDEKIKNSEIMLTSTSRIEKRTRRDSKFVIHSNSNVWYLWCNQGRDDGKQEAQEWVDTLNDIITRKRSTMSPIIYESNDDSDIDVTTMLNRAKSEQIRSKPAQKHVRSVSMDHLSDDNERILAIKSISDVDEIEDKIKTMYDSEPEEDELSPHALDPMTNDELDKIKAFKAKQKKLLTRDASRMEMLHRINNMSGGTLPKPRPNLIVESNDESEDISELDDDDDGDDVPQLDHRLTGPLRRETLDQLKPSVISKEKNEMIKQMQILAQQHTKMQNRSMSMDC